MNKEFKYDLQTIYSEVNRLGKAYQREGVTEIEKHFILVDIIEVTKELIYNQCKNFLKPLNTTITIEDLYAIAIAEPLLEVLVWYDFEKGNNLMVAWLSFMEKRFKNAVGHDCTKGAIWRKTHIYSSDKELNEDGTTICDLVGDTDFAEERCTTISIGEMLDAFEKVDKHGQIIRCHLLKKRDERTSAILHILGAEKYGDKERKAVERVKERFARFLIRNKYDLTGYNLSKFLK